MSGLISKKWLLVIIVVAVLAFLGKDLVINDTGSVLVEVVEKRASGALGVRVDVAGADIDRDEGRFQLSGLVVASPGGFTSGEMLKADTVRVDADFGNRTVESVEIGRIETVIEFRGAETNFEMLGERIADRAVETGGGGASGATKANEESSEAGASATDSPWRIGNIAVDSVHVQIRADWTSRVVEYDMGGWSLDGLEYRTDDVLRVATMEFVHGMLATAVEKVDDRRLREHLAEKTEEVAARVRRLRKLSGE